eukprot:2891390-Rhodomonas_salina.1
MHVVTTDSARKPGNEQRFGESGAAKGRRDSCWTEHKLLAVCKPLGSGAQAGAGLCSEEEESV